MKPTKTTNYSRSEDLSLERFDEIKIQIENDIASVTAEDLDIFFTESLNDKRAISFLNYYNKTVLDKEIINFGEFKHHWAIQWMRKQVYQEFDNHFEETKQEIIKNKDIGNVPFIGNYYIQSRLLSNDIYDQLNNIGVGKVLISSGQTLPNINLPVSMPQNVIKAQVASSVKITWNSNLESDLAGYKIYSYLNGLYSLVTELANVTEYTIPNATINILYFVTSYDINKSGIDDQYNGNESWYSLANSAPNAPTNLALDAG
ncbi:MAG: hypothetical protein WCJ54_08725, partial [Actinomycetota bacterium]